MARLIFFTFMSERDIQEISSLISKNWKDWKSIYKNWCLKSCRNSVHPTFSASFTSCDDMGFCWVWEKKVPHEPNPDKENIHTEVSPTKENNNGNIYFISSMDIAKSMKLWIHWIHHIHCLEGLPDRIYICDCHNIIEEYCAGIKFLWGRSQLLDTHFSIKASLLIWLSR